VFFGDLLAQIVSKQKKENIAASEEQSFSSRKEAKQLLDGTAKRVENALPVFSSKCGVR